MSKIARRTRNIIERTRGRVGREPRCLNLDKQLPDGFPIIGYIEVNKNATTPFSRSKVHKGIFCCDKDKVDNGDLILDRADTSYYFVMDQKMESFAGEDVYIDATMYRCDKVISVYRFSAEGTRDGFGRPIAATPEPVIENIRAMFNPLNFDTQDKPDRQIEDNKIKMCVQSKAGVKVADRIVISTGEMYHVTSIDPISLDNLVFCTVDTDVR